MSWWQLGAVASVVIGVAHLAIAGFVLVGLSRTGQLRTNRLALATGVIFFSSGVGHGLDAYHLIAPTAHGGMGGMRELWTPGLALWDSLTACVAVTYLALRRRYGQLLHTPEMFADELERTTARELRDVLQELREGVVVLDHDGSVQHRNEAARGLDAAALEGEAVARTRTTGQPADDVELALGDRILRLSTRALSREGAAPYRVVVSYVDDTERRRAEVVARSGAAQLRATLDGVTEGVLFYDEDLVIRAVNPAGRRMVGPPGEHSHAEGSEVLGDDGAPLAPEQWPISLAGASGRTASGVIGLRRPGHPDRWLQVNASAVLDEGKGAPWPVVASLTDITERLQRERALVEAEQRVRSTFDAAPFGMRVSDLEGCFVEVNQAFASLLGLEVHELIGRPCREVTHPDDWGAHEAGERRLRAGEIPVFRMEKRFLHAAGHVVWTQIDVTALRDADGVPTATVGQIQDISERRRHDEQLRHLADHDALTGLLNRRGFQRELDRHVAQAGRYGAGGALLMLDLDHFKYINDTLGHKVGDEVIVAVADLLRARLRKTDVVARLGGDEFAVLLPRGSREDANQAAASVLRSLREAPPYLPALGHLTLTASVGVAAIEEDALTGDELMVNADLAMYDAKEGGRDQAADYAAGRYREPRIKARITWMERISAALERERFVLHAQPIFDVRTGSTTMHELLLRMVGEDGELIPPATFLPVAERFELVQAIDRWVIDRACEALEEVGPLSVNVSAKSIDEAGLLDHLGAALARTGADPSRLVVEITETAAITHITHARAFAEGVRELGCGLALDDFGAGFGSFAYLKHLPFDFLKIDGQFVAEARRSEPDALIVRALRDLAHGLGRQVVAECCADAETLEWLEREGIDLAQGFHLGKPTPLSGLASVAGASPRTR